MDQPGLSCKSDGKPKYNCTMAIEAALMKVNVHCVNRKRTVDQVRITLMIINSKAISVCFIENPDCNFSFASNIY